MWEGDSGLALPQLGLQTEATNKTNTQRSGQKLTDVHMEGASLDLKRSTFKKPASSWVRLPPPPECGPLGIGHLQIL